MTWLAIRVLLGGWLKRAGGALVSAFRWLTASVDHLMIAALALTIIIAVCEYQTIGKKTATIGRLTADASKWRAAVDAQAGTIRDQQAEIARQNLAVLTLGKDGAARVAAGAKADDAAVARSAARAKLSDAITVPAPREAVTGCKTDAAVLAAKSEL